MAATTKQLSVPQARLTTTLRPERRKMTPIKWWAAVGGLFIAFQLYLYGAWILSGDATPTSTGADAVPEWMKVSAIGWQAISVIAVILFVYFFVYRQWRRAGHLTLDGMFVIAGASLYWQDPLFNYVQNWTGYNAFYLNLGNWSTHVPGWNAPNSNQLSEMLLLAGPLYVYAVVGGIFIANYLMRRAQARWPRLGVAGTLSALWLVVIAFEFVAEGAFLRFGAWTYPGSIEGLTLWHGHYYQFPIYEIVIWGTTWTALAALRYFKNDKGQTVVERGVERVKGRPAKKTGLRLLAIIGCFNLSMLVLYLIPIIAIGGVHADSWPKDWEDRSYLRNGLCGEGTDYACSGPTIPIPRGTGSGHVNADGEFVPRAGDAP